MIVTVHPNNGLTFEFEQNDIVRIISVPFKFMKMTTKLLNKEAKILSVFPSIRKFPEYYVPDSPNAWTVRGYLITVPSVRKADRMYFNNTHLAPIQGSRWTDIYKYPKSTTFVKAS